MNKQSQYFSQWGIKNSLISMGEGERKKRSKIIKLRMPT